MCPTCERLVRVPSAWGAAMTWGMNLMTATLIFGVVAYPPREVVAACVRSSIGSAAECYPLTGVWLAVACVLYAAFVGFCVLEAYDSFLHAAQRRADMPRVLRAMDRARREAP